MCNSN